jgi:hypothetical protein
MSGLDFAFIKKNYLLPIAFLGGAAAVQTPDAPKPVAITAEPHHSMVLENSYVRVLRFSLPGHQATLLHEHALPYVSVTLGPVDFVNAVAGKPETHTTMPDGKVGYSRGGFAHIVRTDAGTPFNNFTIELLHPQGEPHNLCEKIVDGPMNDCPLPTTAARPQTSPLRLLAQAPGQNPLFETNDILVTLFSIAHKETFTESGSQPPQLLVLEQDSELRVEGPEHAAKTLHGGEAMWLDAATKWTIAVPSAARPTRFLLIEFKPTVTAGASARGMPGETLFRPKSGRKFRCNARLAQTVFALDLILG